MTFPENFIFPGFPGFPDPVGTLMWSYTKTYFQLLSFLEIETARVVEILDLLHDKPPLTHLPLDKMAAISQTIFSNAFSWMKSLVFWLQFHWSLFLRVQLV